MKHSRPVGLYLLIVFLFIVYLLCLIRPASTSAKEFYIWIDEKGINHISNQPPEPGEAIEKAPSKPDEPAKIVENHSLKTEHPQDQQNVSKVAGLSRENPIPFGVPSLTSDGFEITVLSLDRDAWLQVSAENQFNSPPDLNKCMIMLNIRVKNASVPEEPVGWLSSNIALIGSYNRAWTDFGSESRCGVIPAAIDMIDLYKGEEKEGNICFQIPVDETNLLLRYGDRSVRGSEYKYFAAEE